MRDRLLRIPSISSLISSSERGQRIAAHEGGHSFEEYPRDVEVVLFQAHLNPQTREEEQLTQLRRELALIAHEAKFNSDGSRH